MIFILGLILMILGLIFASLNANQVTLDYYYNAVQTPLSVVIFLSFALGLLLGSLVNIIRVFKLKLKMRSLEKKLKSYQKTLVTKSPLHTQ